MRIHALQHVPFEDLAGIADWAKTKNHSITYSRLYLNEPPEIPMNFDFLIILGGPMGAYDDAKYSWMTGEKRLIEKAISDDKLVLGICLGAQLIADVLGALVYKNNEKEIGFHNISLTEDGKKSPFFKGFSETNIVYQWHGDTFEIPDAAKKLAFSDVCENQAFSYGDKTLALQFHVESTVASVNKLIENCGVEIIPRSTIQNAETMKKKVIENQSNLHELLNNLMNNLEALL